MKRLLILFFFLPFFVNGQIVSIQDSSGYLFSVNPLTGVKTQITIPFAGQSGKALSNDGVRYSWTTITGGGNVSNSGTPTAGQTAEWLTSTTVQGINTTGTGSYVKAGSPVLTGTPTIGTLTYAASNPLFTMQSSVNAFNQLIIQNSNTGAAASSDMIVNNDQSTNTTFYGDFGMNSSGYTGSQLSTQPSSVYLTSTSAPLVIGTTTAHAINFVTNDSTGAALNIASDGVVTIPNLHDGTTFVTTAIGTTTLTKQSARYTILTGSAIQTVVLPDARTLTLGTKYYIDNNSTGVVTIQTNGGATLYSLAGNHDVFFVVTDITTAAGVWDTNIFGNLDIANTWAAAQTFQGQTNTAAGTTAIVPININSASVLKTTPAAGDVEYDGKNLYFNPETTMGRGYVPDIQRFRLTADGSTISTIANFFGATSNPTLVSGAEYLIEIDAYFTNTTAGTITWTFTNSAAPTSQNIHARFSPLAGIVAPQGSAAATYLEGDIQGDATAAKALTTSGTLTTATTQWAHFSIHLFNSTGTSLKIQATKLVAGTITPLKGSYWTCTRVPAGNTGTFNN